MRSNQSDAKMTNFEVKKWNHDSTTNILEIQLNKKCIRSHEYKLNIFVSYKNYGSFLLVHTQFTLNYLKFFDTEHYYRHAIGYCVKV